MTDLEKGSNAENNINGDIADISGYKEPEGSADQENPTVVDRNNNSFFFRYMLLASLLTATALILVFYAMGVLDLTAMLRFGRGNTNPQSVIKLQQVWNAISSDFYLQLDENKMIEYAAAGIAAAAEDVYTEYYTKEQMAEVNERASGSFSGIGVSVKRGEGGQLIITDVTAGSPAEEAGVLTDDEIVRVDGIAVQEIGSIDAVIAKIKGETDTIVRIGFFRPTLQEIVEFDITRRPIKTENILSEMLEGQIGYLRIIMFDSEADAYFGQHLSQLTENEMGGLILDLRDNPGGNYEETVKIIDRLVGEGVIVYTEDRSGKREYRNSNPEKLEVPFCVLINQNSASASEVLAGAVKDYAAGVLIGTATYGKGLVQAVITFSDGSGLKYTRSRYFTPNGISIHGDGVTPDEIVKLPEEVRNVPVAGIPRDRDTQLAAAIERLTEKIQEEIQNLP